MNLEAVTHLDPYVNAFKIGSGDINWLEELKVIATLGKPIIVATGAATFEDVQRTMNMLLQTGVPLVLMQCNTNYEGSLKNIHHVNLRVLQQYGQAFPTVTLGLSDHTPGHLTVLGAVALGAPSCGETLHRRHPPPWARSWILNGSTDLARDGFGHPQARSGTGIRHQRN